MIRSRLLLKSFAIFFVVEIIVNTVLPTVSLALTAGPTAPEATSFEPVDTTDMVNLSTGDFVYNIPLLEVPGPSGGYPINLSYHAGIEPDLDASWVGLGFSINAGAINRTVDGAPDDYFGSNGVQRTFWEGGTSKAFSTGATYGPLTADLTYSSDTYRGLSVSHTVGIEAHGYKTGLGITYSVDAFGNRDTDVGISFKSEHEGRIESISQMLESVSSFSSIKTAAKSYFSNRIGVNVQKTKEAGVSTKGLDVNINIPVKNQGVSYRLSAKYQRYWIDEQVTSKLYGSMYLPETKPGYDDIRDHNYDITDLSFLEAENGGFNSPLKIADNSSKGMAGTFLAYDQYNVTGQGIGGAIRPYHLNSNLYRATQRDKDNKVIVQSYPLGGNIKPGFRFVNDFSNSFLYDQDDFTIDGSDANNPLKFSFKNEKISTGDGSGVDGFENGELAGSRSIKWYTKAQVFGTEPIDLIKCNSLGYGNTPNLNGSENGVAGIKITNESGVSYHYALPVYSYDEYSYNGTVDFKNKKSGNTYKRKTRYAYTWLLTAVTGPDFVDRNSDGKANDGDFGYWITFDYGMWAGSYSWRNPAQGYNKDVDQLYDFFSKGKKEIYYLNAIRSQTHTALFVKELRPDGKGVVPEIAEAVQIDSDHNVTKIDEGGFEPVGSTHAVSTLRLKEILLFQNKDLSYDPNTLAGRSTVYDNSILVNEGIPHTVNYHRGSNVIDIHDVEDIEQDLIAKTVRTIHFNHSYDLCPGTPNSFTSSIDQMNPAQDYAAWTNGKLTLNSLRFGGKGGQSLMPDTKFGYETDEYGVGIDGSISYTGYGNSEPSENKKFTLGVAVVSSIEQFNIGDLIRLESASGNYYYGVVLSKESLNLTCYHLGEEKPAFGTRILSLQKTKNPPYERNASDIWGFYKSDYVDFGHANISKVTSEISAQSVDAWSLRKITTSLGADIVVKYGSDRYQNSIKQISSNIIKNLSLHNADERLVKISFYGNNANKIFSPGNTIKVHGILRRKYTSRPYFLKCGCNGVDLNTVYFWDQYHQPAQIQEVGVDYIIVYDPTIVVNYLTVASKYNQFLDCETYREQAAGTPDYRPYDTTEPYEFTGGEVEFATNASAFSLGGGLRVDELSVVAPFEKQGVRTIYEYSNGVTPYEPVGIDVNVPRIHETLLDCVRERESIALDEYKSQYTFKVAYSNFAHLFANARMMPGPGVIYGAVKVQSANLINNTLTNLPSYNVYQFEVFNPKLIEIYNKTLPGASGASDKGYSLYTTVAERDERLNVDRTIDGLTIDKIYTNTVSIQDFSSVIGNLKSVETYDAYGRILSETKNEYLFDRMQDFDFTSYRNHLTGFKNQGLIEEVFADARFVAKEGNTYDLMGLLSKFSQFPSIPVESKSTNFKTGVTQVSKNLAFDFYSGQVTETLATDGYGNTFRTETTPAYRKYSGMGLSINGGDNMLVQQAASYTYKVDAVNYNTKLGLVAASAQTWSDQIPALQPEQYTAPAALQAGIWRRRATYFFIGDDNVQLRGDGLYPEANLAQFNAWNDEATPGGWQKNAEVTLYDVNSHALEVTDINNDFAATKMSIDQTRVFATAANARYNEFAYSGAEEEPETATSQFGGGVYYGGGGFTSSAHTGTKAVIAQPSQRAFTYKFIANAKTYHVSVWSSQPDAVIKYQLGAGSIQQATVKNRGMAKGWYQLEADIATEAGLLEVWCEANSVAANFDDFRIHPLTSAMISYVYNSWGELSHILDNNNLFTEYRYDGMGRLKETYKESFVRPIVYGDQGVVKTSEIKYNYGSQNPYILTITASQTGPSGQVVPSGNVSVKQGDNLTFEMKETCANPRLESVTIDGKVVNLQQPSHTLADGTVAKISNRVITFEKVLTNHTITAKFLSNVVPGEVRCYHVPGSGDTCYDGTLEYAYYDNCGQLGSWYRVAATDLPADLQPFAPAQNCSDLNGPGCEETEN
ncbi:MAG: hypothetical protein ACOYXT_23790 [Bacteroidota bacterium]